MTQHLTFINANVPLKGIITRHAFADPMLHPAVVICGVVVLLIRKSFIPYNGFAFLLLF